jgi:hypothetical protein
MERQWADVRIGVPGLRVFGGWQISAMQYAIFISRNYRKLTPGRQAFMNASYGAGYGLGVLLKKTSSGTYIWHVGNWEPGQPDVTPNQFSSYFGLFENGDLIVVLLDKAWSQIPGGEGPLETALRGAVGLH